MDTNSNPSFDQMKNIKPLSFLSVNVIPVLSVDVDNNWLATEVYGFDTCMWADFPSIQVCRATKVQIRCGFGMLSVRLSHSGIWKDEVCITI